MNKKEYNEALKDPLWIAKRNKIKKRDCNKCTKCGSKKSLQVHHTYYLIGKMPWEVPDSCLVTLCKTCHKKEHEGRDIISFMRQKPPKPTRKEKNKKRKLTKKERLRQSVSKKDEALQKKYDEMNKKREEFYKKRKK